MPKKTPPRSNIKPTIAPSTPYLSVVVPLLDEEDSLKELYQQIVHSAGSLGKPFEIIFIDDGAARRLTHPPISLYHQATHLLRLPETQLYQIPPEIMIGQAFL